MIKVVIVAVIILAAIGAVLFLKPGSLMNQNTSTLETASKITSDQRLTVKLDEQNKSGETGTATLVTVDDGLSATIEVTTDSTDLQPAHIHKGTCDKIGEVVVTLPFPKNGFSEGEVSNVTLSQLKAMGPLAINVHKSEAEPSVYVACGNLVF